MLSEHVTYLRMIRFIDAELNGVCGNRRLFDLAVFSLAGIREMFVNCLNVLDIDIALLIVRRVLGYAE